MTEVELVAMATNYLDDFELSKQVMESIQYTTPHYFRKSLFKDTNLEVVLVCYDHLQSTTLHDHSGSLCVVRCIKGRVMEHSYYKKNLTEDLEYQSMRIIAANDIVAIPVKTFHQITNITKKRSVLLNFYSPPLPALE